MKRLVVVALLVPVACGTTARVAPDRTADPMGALASIAQSAQETLRFAVIGDFGTGSDVQRRVANRMCRWRENHPFRLVVTTGDNIYPDGDPEMFDSGFFEPYACLLEGGVRFRAALGNHDVSTRDGRPEINEPAFGMRARNYVVRTRGVRFVIADSNGLNRAWLRRALTPDEGDRWTIVVFHHPVYSPGTGHGSTPGFRPGLPRMFRRKGVDLALAGHDHIYSVSKPLHGIRYVVTGGGGAPLYGCEDRWFTARCRARHHFLSVTVRSSHITVRAVPPTGRPFHGFRTVGRD
jgi:Calcineurin-like phosphoesterase